MSRRVTGKACNVLSHVLAAFDLVSRTGFTGGGIAFNAGSETGSALFYNFRKHVAHLTGGLSAVNPLRLAISTIFINGELDHVSVTRKHRVGTNLLKQRNCNAVPVGHGCLLDRTPVLCRAQTTGHRTWESDLRRMAEAQLVVIRPHDLRRHQQRHFRRTDVARVLNNARYRQLFAVVGVTDRMTAERHGAADLEERIRRHFLFFEAGSHREGLHRRTRFICIHNGAVTNSCARNLAAVVRVKARVVCKREDVPGLRVCNHNGAALCFQILNLTAQGFISKVLETGVDRERNVFAVHRLF